MLQVMGHENREKLQKLNPVNGQNEEKKKDN